MKTTTSTLKTLAVAVPLSLAAAGVITITAGVAGAPPAQAFGLGDIVDGAKKVGKKVGGAAKKVGSAAKNVGKKTVRAAKKVGKAAKKVRDASVNIRSRAQRAARNAAATVAGEVIGTVGAEVAGRIVGDSAEQRARGRDRIKNAIAGFPDAAERTVRDRVGPELDFVKDSVVDSLKGLEATAQAKPRFRPGQWGGNAQSAGKSGSASKLQAVTKPDKSPVVVDHRERADKARTGKAIWKKAGKALDARIRDRKSDNRVEKAMWKNGMKALKSRTRDKTARDKTVWGRPVGKSKTHDLKLRRKLKKTDGGFSAKRKKRVSDKRFKTRDLKLRRKLDANVKVLKHRKLRKSSRAERKGRRKRDDS